MHRVQAEDIQGMESAKQEDYIAMSEPLYYFAPGVGAVSSRTDWTKSAIQLLAVCGPTLESHQDRNQGAVFLAYDGDWLIASAKNFSHSGLRQNAEDYCCVTVDGQRQTQTQDGCHYLVQEDTPQYTHLMMDLATAYIHQLSFYRRELFWLKPNLLLVRDTFTPVNPAAVVAWNLNVLTQPVADLTGGISLTADGGTKLFGVAQDWKFTGQPVPLEPAQTRPTYRLQLVGAGALSYTVGLEIAPAAQAMRTVTPYASTNLRGMVLGNNALVAAVTLSPPFSYLSPSAGQHFLYGFKPNTAYQVNGAAITSSAAGVLVITRGVTTGQPITITEGGAPPPPPVHGRTWSLYLPADGGPLQVTEVPPAARPEE